MEAGERQLQQTLFTLQHLLAFPVLNARQITGRRTQKKTWSLFSTKPQCMVTLTLCNGPTTTGFVRRNALVLVLFPQRNLRIHQNGCLLWHDRTINAAASTEHLDVVKHLHENGCAWDGLTCSRVAASGHLHVPQCLCENGCP